MTDSACKRVLFLCYHGYGHINPCFALANILISHGHEVTLATSAYFNGHVTRAGFRHYPLKTVPFGLGFEAWTNAEKKLRFPYWATLQDRARDRLYHEREAELSTLVNDLRPDVIFLDGTQATDFIVLYKLVREHKIPIAMIHAMFPTFVVKGRPPANSVVIPGNTEGEAKALRQMKRQLYLTDFRQRLRYLGMSDRFLIRRRLKRNCIPTKYLLTTPSLFDFQVANVPSIILAPREFDFPHFSVPHRHYYIGFPPSFRPQLEDKKWMALKSVIREKKKNGSRLVYCSFGTVDDRNESGVHAFLLRLAESVTRNHDLLLISIGGKNKPPAGLEREQVWVFPTVPQIDVLEESDVFVTHGGLSSIKEAIEAVVPMLMITVHHQYDPPGNAARVQYQGIGLLGNVDCSSEELDGQLRALIQDNRFRENLVALQEKNRSYTAEQFLYLFDNLQPLP